MKWSKGFGCCQECGTIEVAHKAGGLCEMCWDRQYRRLRYRKKVGKPADAPLGVHARTLEPRTQKGENG
jgi:hypothetical protein